MDQGKALSPVDAGASATAMASAQLDVFEDQFASWADKPASIIRLEHWMVALGAKREKADPRRKWSQALIAPLYPGDPL